MVIGKEPSFSSSDHMCNCFFRNLTGDARVSAKEFILSYCRDNYRDSRRMDVIVNVCNHSMPEIADLVMLTYLGLSQDVDSFKAIRWHVDTLINNGSGSHYDTVAAFWSNKVELVKASPFGLKEIVLKTYMLEEIDRALAEKEKQKQKRFARQF